MIQRRAFDQGVPFSFDLCSKAVADFRAFLPLPIIKNATPLSSFDDRCP